MNNMKKIYPYIFPAVALLFVLFLLYRWYNLRTQREGMTSLLEESVVIEQISSDDAMMDGAGDYETVELEGEDPANLGKVRYEIVDDRLLFTVSTTLPVLSEGQYQVWLRQPEDDAQRRALTLEYAKGGYMGSASLDASTLPLEVLVSRELTDDNLLEEVLLTGMIEEETE
jgi:hypothetical protein